MEAKLLMDSSNWLCAQMDELVEECEFFDEYTYLDTDKQMADRVFRMDEMIKRAKWEDKNQIQLVKKYKDLL